MKRIAGVLLLVLLMMPAVDAVATYAPSVDQESTFHAEEDAGSGADEADSLLRILREAVSEPVLRFYPDDYDMDGELEAFAVTGYDDAFESNDCHVYFVNKSGVQNADGSASDRFRKRWNVGDTAIWDMGTKKLFAAGFLISSTNYYVQTWEVNGRKLTGQFIDTDGLDYVGGNLFVICPNEFDGDADGNGRTDKQYFVYWNGKGFTEYGGLKVDKKALSAVPGMGDIIGALEAGRNKVKDAFLRANGIIHVNYRDEHNFWNRNLTIAMVNGKARLIDYHSLVLTGDIEAATYSGVYKKSSGQLKAVYPQSVDAWLEKHKQGNYAPKGDEQDRDVSGMRADEATDEYAEDSNAYVFLADMDIAQIDAPVVPNMPRGLYCGVGWCTAEGAIADLAIDLDRDGELEHLVAYSAATRVIPEHQGMVFPGGKPHELRLAVYESEGAGWTKRADEAVVTPFDTFGCHIKVSVFSPEDGPVIYVHAENLTIEGYYADYLVLRYQNDKLVAALALQDPGYSDAVGLYRIDETDMSEVREASYYDGYAVFESSDYAASYQRALQRELDPFGIDANRSMDPAICAPLCSIDYEYYTDRNRAQIRDYTGLSRDGIAAGAIPQTSVDDAENRDAISPGADLHNAYVRTTADVNMRKGPGLDYQTVGALTIGETLSYLGDSSVDDRGIAWYKAQHHRYGAVWISSAHSELVDGDMATDASPGNSASTGAYIKATGKLNVRSSPDLDGKALGTIAQGKTAVYLDERSKDARGVVWYKISYGNGTGWVSSKYCKLMDD